MAAVLSLALGSWAGTPSAGAAVRAGEVTDSWVTEGTPLVDGGWLHVDDVSCADTADSCLAVGWSSPGSDLIRVPEAQVWDGSAWTSSAHPWSAANGQFTDVSCVDDLTCVAILETADTSAGYQLVLLDDGAWTTLGDPQPTAGLVENLSLDCVSTDSCLIVGDATTAAEVYAAQWDGVSVSDVSFGVADPDVHSSLQDVDCVATDWCVAVGWSGFGLTTQGLVAMWDGATWSTPSVAGVDYEDGTFHAVSCASTTSCLAVGHGHPASELTPVGASYDGTGWTTSSPAPAWGDLYGVDCQAACVVVGTRDFTVSGGAWTPLSLPARATDVDCDAGGCMSVGRATFGGRSYANQLTGGVWHWRPLDNPTAPAPWSAVGCTPGGDCLVSGRVASGGTVGFPLLARHAGGWDASPAAPITGSPRVLAIDCLPDGRCVGVGDQRLGGHAAATVLTWPALGSQPPASEVISAQETRSLSDVDCVTADTCVAVGTRRGSTGGRRGFVRLLTATGTTTTAGTVGFPTLSGLTLSGVACPSLGTCRATGTLRRDGVERGFVATRTGASTWEIQILGLQRPRVDVADIDCLSARRCVAAGSWTDARGSTHPLLFELVRGYWRLATLPGGGWSGVAFSAVDCQAGVCHVVGDSGSGLRAVRSDGGPWLRDSVLPAVSASPTDHARDWDLACTSATECLAVAAGPAADVLRRL